jgi:hypothetical protein
MERLLDLLLKHALPVVADDAAYKMHAALLIAHVALSAQQHVRARIISDADNIRAAITRADTLRAAGSLADIRRARGAKGVERGDTGVEGVEGAVGDERAGVEGAGAGAVAKSADEGAVVESADEGAVVESAGAGAVVKSAVLKSAGAFVSMSAVACPYGGRGGNKTTARLLWELLFRLESTDYYGVDRLCAPVRVRASDTAELRAILAQNTRCIPDVAARLYQLHNCYGIHEAVLRCYAPMIALLRQAITARTIDMRTIVDIDHQCAAQLSSELKIDDAGAPAVCAAQSAPVLQSRPVVRTALAKRLQRLRIPDAVSPRPACSVVAQIDRPSSDAGQRAPTSGVLDYQARVALAHAAAQLLKLARS